MKNLQIINADIVGDLIIRLFFNDDTVQDINIGDFIRRHPHPQYNKYLDPKLFSNFNIENGNIVWGDDWDLIFPIEQLHDGKII